MDYEYSRSNNENRYEFKDNYLKKNFFSNFYCMFGMYIKFGPFWKENEPHSSSISKVIDCKRRAYFNA